ncbi:hypothetical protein Tco_0151148 [Tanacetum coccineum]
MPEPLGKIEKGIKNDIEPIAPTMTMNRLVLEWEERIKLHQEKEMENDQWRSNNFNNEFPTPKKGNVDLKMKEKSRKGVQPSSHAKKSLYDAWKSGMEHYIENRENGRMIINSVQNGPLIWPTVIEENGTIRTKKYEELSATKKIQADYDCKATNIVLQGLPPYVYAIVNHHKVAKEIWDKVKLLMQGTKLSLQEKECKLYDEFDKFTFVKGLAIPMFNPEDDPIAFLNKAMAFLTALASLRFPSTNNKLRNSSNPRNQATIQDDRTGDLDAYDSDCDDVSNAKAVLMANLSSYGSDVLSEVPHFEPYQTDMDNQSVHAMQGFEQTPVADFTDTEITSDSNIIPYS